MNMRKRFEGVFQKKCLKLFVSAYQTARNEKSVKIEWKENDITKKLHEYLKINPVRKEWNISTDLEHYIDKANIGEEKGFADKSPRIDLKFSTFTFLSLKIINFQSSFEYFYFIEAKRLKENDKPLQVRYISTGIDNFTSKKYDNGCLIGYLVEGNLKLTITKINSLLEKDNRKTEFLNFKESDLHDFYYESEHIEIGILKHFIFDFTEE